MSDYANIRPWVQASIRNGADIPAEHANVLFDEINRLTGELAEYGNKYVAAAQTIERVRALASQLDLDGEQTDGRFWPRAEEKHKAAKRIRATLDGGAR